METANLLSAVIFSSFGLAYFVYGKKQSAITATMCGVSLMLLPLLISSLVPLVLAGLVLVVLPWVYRY